MIAFVEMAHDKRTYSFVQETRHGRVIIAESEKVERMVDAMTDYVARRLVEREAALAADLTKQYALKEAMRNGKSATVASAAAAPARQKSRFRRSVETALLFTIELLGAIVLFILLIGAAYFLWRYARACGSPITRNCAEALKLDGAEVADMFASGRRAAYARFDLPAVAGFLEAIKMVGRAMQRRAGHSRRRRHAHDRHAPAAALDMAHLQAVIVAVDDQLRAMAHDHLLELARIA